MKNNILANYFKGKKTLVVAEMSGNHNLNLRHAIKMINSIKKTGADAVKIQLYTPDTITFNSNNRDFLLKKKISGAKIKIYILYTKKLIRPGIGIIN